MYKNLFVFSFANGRDIVASATHLMAETDGSTKFGDLHLPATFMLTKPRLLMMQQTPEGIKVGMAPVNIDDAGDTTPIPFNTAALAYCYALPDSSKLGASYVQSVSSIDLTSKLPARAPVGNGAFRAN